MKYDMHTSEGLRQNHLAARNAAQPAAVTALEESLMREGAAYTTRKCYASTLRKLVAWYQGNVDEATREDLLAFLTYCIEEQRYSRSTMNQAVNALRAYYERVLGRAKDELHLPRPRKERSVPGTCSEEAALRMIRETPNRKHRTMLAMIYGLGLRKGELQALLVKDVDLDGGLVRIAREKGDEHRELVLQEDLQRLLSDYLDRYRPRHWLFEGQAGGPYSATSIQAVFTAAKERSGLPEQMTVHGLRHSYAAHLVARGTPLEVVKDLLGYESVRAARVGLYAGGGDDVEAGG